ncbi:hypothetical protein EC957_004191 [Mortierella hygrophila]|uniref:Zn(2)-C6 fungal-type domain-containing protein n=1 Tax=Mortierella hygrophila TaxID=979708 RepID=A0A9P6FI75_9FUNG|nr:hypothetical protein EC957_004191 [Mortierella hygrophila]
MTKIKPRLIARISCQECRRRKTRCNYDGQGDKCSTCARIGTPCIFSQKNGVVLDMDKVMEENNPHLVHQREKEQRAKERERERDLLQAGLSSSHPSSGFATRPNRSNSAGGMPGRSSSTEDLSHVMGRLQIDNYGIAPHTLRCFSQVAGDNDSAEPSSGESSAIESVEPSTSTVTHDPDQPFHKRRSNSDAISGTQQRTRGRSEPLVDIQPDLIDLYFQHVHPFLLIIHKPSFLRRLYDPKDPVPDFLLAAIYAVASQYTPGRVQDGRRYFDLWLSRLDDTLDKPRLSTIQALLLIIKYQESVKHNGFYFRTYMYAQMVIVLARELQLHKTSPVSMKLDKESHEVRRRLFWSIFVLDQFISVSQGRSMSFRDVEPEADMPCINNEDPDDTQEVENILNFIEYIKLSKINHQALMLVRKSLTKAIRAEDAIPQCRVITSAMVAWKANLPIRLQLASNMSARTPFGAMLHMVYHACQLMTLRSFCDDISVSQPEMTANSRETCSVSATNITVITDDLFTNHGIVSLTYPVRGCYFVIYCLIAAATIQANDIRRGTSGPIMFKRSLALLNIILRESTAADIEKEVELLKNSMDSSMDYQGDYAYSPNPQYDHRPPLKHILPMSQKYGSRMPFGSSGVTPIRVRKISPKVGGPATGSSNGVSKSKTAAGHPDGSQGFNDRTPGATQSNPGQVGQPMVSSAPLPIPVDSKASVQLISNSLNNNLPRPQQQDQGTFNTGSNSGTANGWAQARDRSLDDLNRLKLTSSPEVPSRPIHTSLPTAPTLPSTNASLSSFPGRAPYASDFNGLALAQQQPMSTPGGPTPAPMMSLAQFLSLQEEQQRQQKQSTQFLDSSPPVSSLDRLSAAQIQEQHRLNQQRQFMHLQREHQQRQQQQQQQPQQQQQQQQSNSADLNSFLSDFSSLTSYQQLNSDQAQNELMRMLSSSVVSYQDGFSNESAMSFATAYLQQQQQSGLHPNTFPAQPLSPPTNAVPQQEGYVAPAIPNDTPSPDSFQPIDMASSFPSYLCPDSNVPVGIRQALGDADRMFRFQAQQGLAGADDSLFPNERRQTIHSQQQPPHP